MTVNTISCSVESELDGCNCWQAAVAYTTTAQAAHDDDEMDENGAEVKTEQSSNQDAVQTLIDAVQELIDGRQKPS